MSVHYRGEETLIYYEIINNIIAYSAQINIRIWSNARKRNDFYSVGVRFERFGRKTERFLWPSCFVGTVERESFVNYFHTDKLLVCLCIENWCCRNFCPAILLFVYQNFFIMFKNQENLTNEKKKKMVPKSGYQVFCSPTWCFLFWSYGGILLLLWRIKLSKTS